MNSYFLIMSSKVLKATSRGQVTLPKDWRDQFNTEYFISVVEGDSLIIKPLVKDDLKKSVESAWEEYENGEYVTSEALMKKYGL